MTVQRAMELIKQEGEEKAKSLFKITGNPYAAGDQYYQCCTSAVTSLFYIDAITTEEFRAMCTEISDRSLKISIELDHGTKESA